MLDRMAKFGAALLLAAFAAGCGVRGALDPPPGAKAAGEATSGEAAAAGEDSAAKPKPHRDFVLDGLIQ